MSTPSRKEMLDHLRIHYGLTISETMDVVNIPLHPFEMRDEFAKVALTGLISHYGSEGFDTVAIDAYKFADAMLEARIKRG